MGIGPRTATGSSGAAAQHSIAVISEGELILLQAITYLLYLATVNFVV